MTGLPGSGGHLQAGGVVKPYWSDKQVTLYLGDCLEVLAGMDAASVDAIATDPPYGLEFMGREWDSFKPSGAKLRTREDGRTNPGARPSRGLRRPSRTRPGREVRQARYR